MKKIIGALTAVLLVAACGQKAEQKNEGQSSTAGQQSVQKNGFNQAELDIIMDRYKAEQGFMGSVAISKAGKSVYTYAAGYSDYENKVLATADTRYRIGSVSKTFTALLVLKAVEEGRMSLSDKLSKYYPAMPNADQITIKHMLEHTSGLPSYTRDPDFKDIAYKGAAREAMLTRFQTYKSNFTPGEREDYSNTTIYLMTLILETIYQKSYAQLIEDKIANPLGLKGTYYGEMLSAERNEAYPYHTADGVTRAQDFHHSTMLGAGGMISTPTELTQVYDALFTGKIIQPETLDTMIDIKNTFGLGIEKMTYTGRKSYGHRGRVSEFNSIIMHHPAEKISIAITDNSSFGDIPAIVKDILNAYFKADKIAITAEEVEKFVGRYQGVKDPSDISVFERSGNKLINVIKGEFRAELIYKGNGNFLLDQSYAPAITFRFSDDGQRMRFLQSDFDYEYVKIK